jgi:DNA-binding CsgD family transcriptional regulator
VSNFDGWLKSITVLYVGDPKSPHMGWLAAAGARVIKAENADEARSAMGEDVGAIDAAVLDADWPGLGWVGFARDLPASCGIVVVSEKPDVAALDTIQTVRAEFVTSSASEADFLFRLKTVTKLSVPSMRRLAANASKLWSLPRQLSRLLYYNLWSYSDQEIADAMGLSRHTIQEYQDELRRRTGVRTKHAYLRRLLEYAGEEPPLSMSDTTRAHVTQFRRRAENGGLHS